jgi:formylglycine-generating enzyme required for sulfatase activity
VKLLKGQVFPHRVGQRAREQGIDFEVTSAVERELRQAGASDELIATLREIAPKPSTPPKPPEKPAEIVVQTSPGAEVYVDDEFAGRASPQGRLVVSNPRPGDHTLRVSLAGKRDYEQQDKVTVGETSNVQAALPDIEKPKLQSPVEPPQRTFSAPAIGTVRENPKDGLKYVWIPAGTFMMGCSPGDTECSDSEKPSHQVTITRGFWIGQTPVTVGAYKRFARTMGRQMPVAPNFNTGWANENMPIANVSWDDAQTYCGWIGGRLPTEAEWEYGARGGSTEARYGNLDEIAWYNQDSGKQAHDIAQKRPNGFGLYDMLGNVWEWVSDWYDEYFYQSSPSQDPSGPASGQDRVLRGGSWNYRSRDVRVSSRSRPGPGGRNVNHGFRCGEEVAGP